jgi:uncharacterized protein YacL
MSFEFVLRLVGAVALAVVGLRLGVLLAGAAGAPPEIWALVASLVGVLAGLVLTPFFTTRPARAVQVRLSQVPAQTLVAGVTGLIVGLIAAALSAFPLSLLPRPLSQIMPFVGAIVFSYFGIVTFVRRQRDLFDVFQGRLPQFRLGESDTLTPSRQVLLDTSVIIDGRIADISRTGFISGPMVVPRFVLNELQHIADSPDALRRNRGRRGLDILNRLQKDSLVPVRITDADFEDVEDVDEKLVVLAKQMRCAIVTNDYNLNRVAEIQGVPVLNINELANAVKTIYLPGESMQVRIIQEGKELGQGVAYLDDGTMVVVEEGRRHINSAVDVIVTKVLQTSAGRMIFARIRDQH